MRRAASRCGQLFDLLPSEPSARHAHLLGFGPLTPPTVTIPIGLGTVRSAAVRPHLGTGKLANRGPLATSAHASEAGDRHRHIGHHPLGDGNDADQSKAQPLPAGSFFHCPQVWPTMFSPMETRWYKSTARGRGA